MCMCGALRRVVICFGWNGVEENRQRGREVEMQDKKITWKRGQRQRCVKDWRVHERIDEDEAPDMGATAVERIQIPRFACPRRQAGNGGFAAR
jgi:hypothetical protein